MTMSRGRHDGDLGGEAFRRGAGARQQQGGPGPRIVIVSHRAECYLPPTRLTTHRTALREPRRHILGLESSCDDTAAALLRGRVRRREILSSVVIGQTDLHALRRRGARDRRARPCRALDRAVEAALDEAGVALPAVDAIAVTAGPGLIGGVLSGVMTAKGLAMGLGKPLIGVNHLAGHALTPRLTDGARFPYLLLLVSGGHCQILRVDGTGTPSPGSAAPSTTPRARPSTRSRASSACRSPAGPRSRGGGKGRSGALRLPAPAAWTGPAATCPFRAEDRRAARAGPADAGRRAG
jgi:hypothetical protein